MRITYFYAENMAGIKAGSGLNKIEIKFNKRNKNPFTLLVGGNGSGKSTLLSLLQPFRETNDGRNPVINGEKAYKEIHILDNNDEYIIKHTWKPNKSFIIKNGEDLNESGSIKLFNQVMKEELGLDEEYFKIARLGSNVTNFIDLTSGARKTYIGNFMPYIDDYLTLYSEVKKTYTILNREFNNISTQLDKFPDYDTLKEKRDSLKITFNNLSKSLKTYNKKYVKLEESINNNEKIFKEKYGIEYNEDTIGELNEFLEEINEKLDIYKKNFSKNRKKINDLYKNILEIDLTEIKAESKFKSLLEECKEIVKDSEIEYNEALNKLNNLKINIDNINKDLEQYEKMVSIDYSYEIDRLNDNIKKLQEEYNELDEEIPDEFKDEEFDTSDFSELVANYNNIFESIYSLLSNEDLEKDLVLYNTYNREELDDMYSKLDNEKSELYLKLQYLENNVHLLETLDKRPKDCKNNKCEFIIKSLEFKKEYDKYCTYEEEFNIISSKVNDTIDKLNKYISTEKYIKRAKEIFKKIDSLKIQGGIYYKTGLEDYEKYFDDFNLFLEEFLEKNIDSIQNFFDINQDYQYYKKFNSLLNYKDLIETKKEKIKILKKEKKNTDSITKMYEDKKKDRDKYENELKEIKEEVQEKQDVFDAYTNLIEDLNVLISNLKNIKEYKKEKDKVKEKIISFSKYYKENKDSYEKIDNLNEEISDIEENIERLNKEIDSANKDLNYIEILLENKNKLDRTFSNTKLIRDALDPKKGIPLIFIEKFLDKIEIRTNELLNIAYGSDFRIKFDITDKDFFIKVFKTFSDLEDISQASQGETSLTTLSLSLAMMQYMVKKYNVLYLDEIDGTLSTANKRIFLSMLEKQIEELDLEQVFIITHNNEFYSYPVNLILFNLEETDIDMDDSEFLSNKEVLFNLHDYKEEVDNNDLIISKNNRKKK